MVEGEELVGNAFLNGLIEVLEQRAVEARGKDVMDFFGESHAAQMMLTIFVLTSLRYSSGEVYKKGLGTT